MHPSHTRAQVYQVDDPCYDIGGCPTNWYQDQRSYMWYLKSYTSGVIPIFGRVHKNARFKPQPSTLMQAFASMRSTPFMEINDKGGEIVQRYESLEIKIVQER